MLPSETYGPSAHEGSNSEATAGNVGPADSPPLRALSSTRRGRKNCDHRYGFQSVRAGSRKGAEAACEGTVGGLRLAREARQLAASRQNLRTGVLGSRACRRPDAGCETPRFGGLLARCARTAEGRRVAALTGPASVVFLRRLRPRNDVGQVGVIHALPGRRGRSAGLGLRATDFLLLLALPPSPFAFSFLECRACSVHVYSCVRAFGSPRAEPATTGVPQDSTAGPEEGTHQAYQRQGCNETRCTKVEHRWARFEP
jgi:hypothetical protein